MYSPTPRIWIRSTCSFLSVLVLPTNNLYSADLICASEIVFISPNTTNTSYSWHSFTLLISLPVRCSWCSLIVRINHYWISLVSLDLSGFENKDAQCYPCRMVWPSRGLCVHISTQICFSTFLTKNMMITSTSTSSSSSSYCTINTITLVHYYVTRYYTCIHLTFFTLSQCNRLQASQSNLIRTWVDKGHQHSVTALRSILACHDHSLPVSTPWPLTKNHAQSITNPMGRWVLLSLMIMSKLQMRWLQMAWMIIPPWLLSTRQEVEVKQYECQWGRYCARQ